VPGAGSGRQDSALSGLQGRGFRASGDDVHSEGAPEGCRRDVNFRFSQSAQKALKTLYSTREAAILILRILT
jgi:hypothetical protein